MAGVWFRHTSHPTSGAPGPVVQVAEKISKFEISTKELGLQLNYGKCEIVGLSSTTTRVWRDTSFQFAAIDSSHATLLGAPIGRGGMDVAITSVTSQCTTLQLAARRLSFLSSHEAIYLLKPLIAVARLQYLLRTAPCFLSPELHAYDQILSNTIMAITNTSLDSKALTQAFQWGGIGIRSACALAPLAYLWLRMPSQTGVTWAVHLFLQAQRL